MEIYSDKYSKYNEVKDINQQEGIDYNIKEEETQQEQLDAQYSQQQQQLANAYGRAVYPNQDQGFLKWLFSFRKEAVEPLRHVWRGEEYDFDNHQWLHNKNHKPLMNEKGVSWCISLIESYMNPTFLVTCMDEKTYCHIMRQVVRDIWNNLCKRYVEFGITDKTDIPRIANEIESKVCSIIRGSLNDGYRDFFSTQNQNIETKNLSPMEQQKRPGIFSSMANMFRRSGEGQVR